MVIKFPIRNVFPFCPSIEAIRIPNYSNRNSNSYRDVWHPMGFSDCCRNVGCDADAHYDFGFASKNHYRTYIWCRQIEIMSSMQKGKYMKAVIFPGGSQVQFVDLPTPTADHGDVVIKVKASSICRSDMGLYTGESNIVGGEKAGTGVVVPGHEPAGVIVEVGTGVEVRRVGDRVAVHLALGCGQCGFCNQGFTYLCAEWKCIGFDVNGGNAEYIQVPERNALPLPDSLSFVAGALMTDMVGTQYHVQNKLEVRGGKNVLVVGLGPMGSAAVLVAKAFGARVIGVDVLPERLEFAMGLGADEVINSDDKALGKIMQSTDGRGADVVVECSGNSLGQNLGLNAAAKLGAFTFVGESRETTLNPSDQIIRKMLTVVGGWYFPISDWPKIVDLVLTKKINVERLVTHTFSLDQAALAFDQFYNYKTEKAVFILE